MPSVRDGKVARVGQWLAARGRGWGDVERTTFYSDSINDLPLLEQVDHPVATNPDARAARPRARARLAHTRPVRQTMIKKFIDKLLGKSARGSAQAPFGKRQEVRRRSTASTRPWSTSAR